jgi:hypothetical protein
MDYERKLRKKAKKLAKWAKRNGFEYVHVGVMAPDASSNKWFTDVTAHHMFRLHNFSTTELYKEEEL